MQRRVRTTFTAVVVATLAACTSTVPGDGSLAIPGASTTPGVSGPPVAPACPTTLAAPDPKRPKVALNFTLADDLTSVNGTERITFTPDLPIKELVFRLTPNTGPSVRQGNKVVINSATADNGAGAATYSEAGADPSTQGGLLHIPFPSELPAGTTVTADISFTVTLGREAFDRFAYLGEGEQRYAWFGSAHPLLAWERGVGWHTEPMLRFTAESATSEAMQTELTVVAPASATVIMSGFGVATDTGATKTWRSTVDAARDVSVAVGPFTTRDLEIEGVKVRVGAYDAESLEEQVIQFQKAVTGLVRFFGPFPFPSLSVARLPASGGGIEYPSSILQLSPGAVVAVHETAHQYFYALVGNSQAMHAWLDEAFASYGEQLVNGGARTSELSLPGPVDKPTADYGANEFSYYSITYDKGAAALHAARAAAGQPKFDAAIRCYINVNAWTVADPADLASALKELPAAIKVLQDAGALK